MSAGFSADPAEYVRVGAASAPAHSAETIQI